MGGFIDVQDLGKIAIWVVLVKEYCDCEVIVGVDIFDELEILQESIFPENSNRHHQ